MMLHDHLADAVADVSADLPSLTAASRKRGLALRRRRRALATVGTAAAVAALAVGTYAWVPGAHGPDGTVAADVPAPVVTGPLSGETAPATSRGVAAALAAAVDGVADGTFGRFQGDATRFEAIAALLFQPDAGAGPPGQVMVNVQPVGTVGRPPYSCGSWYMEGCTVRQLPNGDTLRTYHQDDDTEFGVGSRRMVAEVLSPERRLRVIVNSLNSNPWADGYRERPALSTAQLTEIATLPWWDRSRLPREYVEAGMGLEDYEDAHIDARTDES
jgi:hypothetical protein